MRTTGRKGDPAADRLLDTDEVASGWVVGHRRSRYRIHLPEGIDLGSCLSDRDRAGSCPDNGRCPDGEDEHCPDKEDNGRTRNAERAETPVRVRPDPTPARHPATGSLLSPELSAVAVQPGLVALPGASPTDVVPSARNA